MCIWSIPASSLPTSAPRRRSFLRASSIEGLRVVSQVSKALSTTAGLLGEMRSTSSSMTLIELRKFKASTNKTSSTKGRCTASSVALLAATRFILRVRESIIASGFFSLVLNIILINAWACPTLARNALSSRFPRSRCLLRSRKLPLNAMLTATMLAISAAIAPIHAPAPSCESSQQIQSMSPSDDGERSKEKGAEVVTAYLDRGASL